MWVTTEEVEAITLKAVTPEQVAAAQIIVELFADTTEESTDLISSKNLRLLKQAVAFQATWLTAHPDAYTNTDFSVFKMDGLGVTNRHANTMILAPLAKRCIDRLSWKRNRSVIIRKPGFRGNPVSPDPNNADLDDRRTDWRPIELH
ncbi:hypothetical protein OG264_11700 [Streptomyces xanthophaeus]|uniref:hypothetical protein n=1 Tax=Streptomyces xanthophaeus TaxID=67385 RepID=UPI0038689AFF|nr:hypothetical protein OG264_11700 [Streptomyces xanthophaeus]